MRYYAFVPDAPGPLSSRGEADSFLHDLSLALEERAASEDRARAAALRWVREFIAIDRRQRSGGRR